MELWLQKAWVSAGSKKLIKRIFLKVFTKHSHGKPRWDFQLIKIQIWETHSAWNKFPLFWERKALRIPFPILRTNRWQHKAFLIYSAKLQELIFAKTHLSPNPVEKICWVEKFQIERQNGGKQMLREIFSQQYGLQRKITNTPQLKKRKIVVQLWLNLPHKSFKLCGSEAWTLRIALLCFCCPGTLAALYHFRILTFVFICPFVFCMLSICILYVVCHTRAYSSSCCWTSVGSSPSQHGTCCKWQRPGIFIKLNMTTKTSNIARGTTDPEIDSVTWD